jgi:hypothetical protein
MGVGGQHHTLAALPLGKEPSAHFTGGSLGFMTSPDECGNITHNGSRSPERPALSESIVIKITVKHNLSYLPSLQGVVIKHFF